VLKSLTATEKDTITLHCELDEPDGEVKWFKNGEELQQDKRIQIVKEGRKRKVIIKDAKITDAAMYKCTSNADTTEGEIVVDCKSITKNREQALNLLFKICRPKPIQQETQGHHCH
jgi:hypothetical protein